MYKYECINLEYLQMESGLKPVPADSADTYIVKPVETGDKGIAGDKIYEYNGSDWVYIEDYDIFGGVDDDIEI